MRHALPSYGKLSKEASVCMQQCVSEFISFITSQAAEKCSLESRKTLNGEDILLSMDNLGFENYAEALKIYLAKYRHHELKTIAQRREKYLARKRERQKRGNKKNDNNAEDKEEGDDSDQSDSYTSIISSDIGTDDANDSSLDVPFDTETIGSYEDNNSTKI